MSLQFGDEVDHANQSWIIQDLVQARKRSQQNIDDRFEWLEDIGDFVGNRFEHITNKAAHFEPQVVEPDFRFFGTTVQRPAPADYQVGVKRGQPFDPVQFEHQLEIQRGLQADIQIEYLLQGLRNDPIERQPASGHIANDVQLQKTE